MPAQIEHLFRLDQHAVSLVVDGTHFDGLCTNDAFEHGVGVAEHALWLVDFARDSGVIPFVFEVHASAPEASEASEYDNVVEASLRVPGRKLSLINEFDTLHALTLPAVEGDAWRVRVHYAGRDTGRVDMDEGAEHVRIALFPGAMGPLVALRPRSSSEVLRTGQTERELRAWLEGESFSHRALAAVALLRLGALEPVRVALQSTAMNPGLRLVVASSLWLAGEAAHADLRQLAEDPDALVRERAARSMGLTQNLALRSALERLTTDPVAAVRDTAHLALGDIDPTYVMPSVPQAPPQPTMILCTVSALGDKLSAKASAKYGACAMWYLRQVDLDQRGMRIFEQIPEPRSNRWVDEVMAVLEGLLTDHSDDLHAVVGPDDSLQFGFHAAATLAQARACFAADGYAIVEPTSVPEGVHWPVALRR